MVIKDLDEATTATDTSNPAPYLDRFFANVIDFLILVPVISLFNSGITNDLRWAMFNQSSTDAYLLIFQYGFISFSLFLLYETLFIYFNKATPGHQFLYLRLVSENEQPLTLFQILFRTVFKFQAILVGGLPFVEIAVRPDRSMFYDRLSQAKIVTLRKVKKDEIHPEFRKIIFRWIHTAIILTFVFVGLAFYQTVARGRESSRSVASKTAPQCQDSLEQYLKSYLSKSKESENLHCARIQVEKLFDSKKTEKTEKTFSYLAQLVITPNEDLKESYKNKYCADRPTKPLCQADWQAHIDGFKPDSEDVVNLLIEMNAALVKNDHQKIFSLLDLLYTHLDWNKNLELYYLTSFVFLNENQGRSPASEKASRSKWQSMKTRFLKRMSVPE